MFFFPQVYYYLTLRKVLNTCYRKSGRIGLTNKPGEHFKHSSPHPIYIYNVFVVFLLHVKFHRMSMKLVEMT